MLRNLLIHLFALAESIQGPGLLPRPFLRSTSSSRLMQLTN